MRIPNPRKPRCNHMHGSGRSHVRYDHKQRPTQLDIVCPRCRGLAWAQMLVFDKRHLHTGDTSTHWRQKFSVHCTACLYRAHELDYQSLGEPFHQISIMGKTLWAWNLQHLRMVRAVLAGESVAGHPYAYYATYIHRVWLLKRRQFLREIDRHLLRVRHPARV